MEISNIILGVAGFAALIIPIYIMNKSQQSKANAELNELLRQTGLDLSHFKTKENWGKSGFIGITHDKKIVFHPNKEGVHSVQVVSAQDVKAVHLDTTREGDTHSKIGKIHIGLSTSKGKVDLMIFDHNIHMLLQDELGMATNWVEKMQAEV